MMSPVNDSHPQSQSVLGLHSHMSLHGLYQSRVNGVGHRHAVDHGTVCVKAPLLHETDRVSQKIRFLLIALFQPFHIRIAEIHIKIGCHIQPQRHQPDAGLIDHLCRLRIYIHVPFTLRRVPGRIQKGIFVESERAGNGNDLRDHFLDLRSLDHGHGDIAHRTCRDQRHLSWIRLHQLNDQIHRIQICQRHRGLRQVRLCLSVLSMGKWVRRRFADDGAGHAAGSGNVRPSQQFQYLSCVFARHIHRIVSIDSRDSQYIQRLRLDCHDDGHGIIHPRITIQYDLLHVLFLSIKYTHGRLICRSVYTIRLSSYLAQYPSQIRCNPAPIRAGASLRLISH